MAAALSVEVELEARPPDCAEKLRDHSVDQRCSHCSCPAFADGPAAREFADVAKARVPTALAVCALCSAVPIIGVLPGVFYYRLDIVAPLRSYLPASSVLWTRWILRASGLALLMLQVVPLVGTLSVPLMCWLNARLYSRRFEAEITGTFSTPIGVASSGRDAPGGTPQKPETPSPAR